MILYKNEAGAVEMKAGRELNTLVAERVMGLRQSDDFGTKPLHAWVEADTEYNNYECSRCRLLSDDWVASPFKSDEQLRRELAQSETGPCDVAPPDYSTDGMDSAWEVVRRLNSLGFGVTIHTYSDGFSASVTIYKDDKPVTTNAGHGVQYLICDAALSAVEVSVPA